MKTGIELIADERQNQVAKGYDARHDDEHDDESLAQLAAFLAVPDDDLCARVAMAPWAAKYADHIRDKWGGDRIHQLVIAGALIAAEIERLQRHVVEAQPVVGD